MKPNVFIFHGTAGYPEENWYPWLRDALAARGYEVFLPKFPTPEGQSLEAWLEVLKPYQGKINEQTILIGHSLGGLFLLHLLEQLEHPVRAAVIVAAPVGVRPIKNYDADVKFAPFSFDWKAIRAKADKFIVYHSDNDPYISLGNGQELAKQLGVELTFIPGAGHFNKTSGYVKFEHLLERLDAL